MTIFSWPNLVENFLSDFAVTLLILPIAGLIGFFERSKPARSTRRHMKRHGKRR